MGEKFYEDEFVNPFKDKPAVGGLVTFFGGPFHGELRFVGGNAREVTLPVVPDPEHPSEARGLHLYSVKQTHGSKKRTAVYVGPSPNQTYSEDD